MATRVKIEARVSAEGAQVLGSDWVSIDLEKGFSPRFSKDVNTLSDVNKLITDGMLNFSVPQSKTNDIVFMDSGSPLITDNRDTGVECRIYVDGRQYPFDRIWVKNKQKGRWEIEVRRSPNHWLELASLKKLNSIDIGTQELNNDVRIDLADQYFIDGGAITRWFPCDYGNWVDLSEPVQFTDPPLKGVNYEDLRPWFSIPELLKIGFCEIGWTLQGQILGTKWSRSQWAYILSREYYTQSKGGNHIVIQKNFSDTNMNLDFVGASSLVHDPGTNNVLPYPGIINTLPYKAHYKFTFVGVIENAHTDDWELKSQLHEYDPPGGIGGGLTGVVFDEVTTVLVAGTEKTYTITLEADLESGQKAVIYLNWRDNGILDLIGVTAKSGYVMQSEVSQKSLVRGDVVELARLINADYFLLDLFKGYVHMIGGRIETDIENKIVSVYPYKYTDAYGDPAEGFVKDDEPPIILDGMVICESEQLGRIRNNLPRYTRLSFADSSDSYVSEFVKPQEPLFSRKVLNGADLPDTVNDLKNPFFEPTVEIQSQILRRQKDATGRYHPSPYLPVLHDNTEGNRSFAIGPRVLLSFGNAKQVDPDSGLECKIYMENEFLPNVPTSEFGYASQLPTLEFLAGSEPEVDAKLTYGSYPDDLYVKFYLDTLAIEKGGFNINALVLMTGTDYSAWDFRTRFLYTLNGKPVAMLGQRIRDFAAALDIPTPMDFVIEAPSTTCCDLPCGCRFMECDYYQDFGQYMTQDTLDELSITSFKVNEIEQLEGPIDFGILRIVEFNGLQFCMNMVDALTSIGVDYFSFRPSTQIYEPKSDARFFRIKRPVCWTFEIIISDGDGEVYRYTETTQEQKWFDADWSPFGYSETPIGDPNNCVQTTEY